MEKLNMCRICLATGVRMNSILNTHLQDVYEKLTLKQVRIIYFCTHRNEIFTLTVH